MIPEKIVHIEILKTRIVWPVARGPWPRLSRPRRPQRRTRKNQRPESGPPASLCLGQDMAARRTKFRNPLSRLNNTHPAKIVCHFSLVLNFGEGQLLRPGNRIPPQFFAGLSSRGRCIRPTILGRAYLGRDRDYGFRIAARNYSMPERRGCFAPPLLVSCAAKFSV
jgi:hypothetical protein